MPVIQSSLLDRWLLVLLVFSTTVSVQSRSHDSDEYLAGHPLYTSFTKQVMKHEEVLEESRSEQMAPSHDDDVEQDLFPRKRFHNTGPDRSKRRAGGPIFGRKDLFKPYPRFDSNQNLTEFELTPSKEMELTDSPATTLKYERTQSPILTSKPEMTESLFRNSPGEFKNFSTSNSSETTESSISTSKTEFLKSLTSIPQSKGSEFLSRISQVGPAGDLSVASEAEPSVSPSSALLSERKQAASIRQPDRINLKESSRVVKIAKRSVVVQKLNDQDDNSTFEKYVPVPHGLPKYGGNQIKIGSRMASSRDNTINSYTSSNTVAADDSTNSNSRAATSSTAPVMTQTATLCNKSYLVDDGEMLLLYADYQPYRYSCQQEFQAVQSSSAVKLTCSSVSLRINCAFEQLVLTGDGGPTTLCRNDPAPVLTSSKISLSFRRTVSGLNGGYFCTVAGVAAPSPTMPPGAGSCPSCGVTKFTVKHTATGNSSSKAATTKSILGVSSRANGEAGGGITSKIVGGTNAEQEAHPWQALVRIHAGVEMYFCGGTLITAKLVLSAAHCLYGLSVTNIEIDLGLLDRTNPEAGSEHFDTKLFNIHQDYSPSTFLNDISVIHLSTPVTFSSKIQPACLPTEDRDIDNQDVVATGWGLTTWDGTLSTKLQEVTLKVWANSRCEEAWRTFFSDYSFQVPSSQTCALNPGKDTCSGDSGGPLVTQTGGHAEVVGITSFGYECATPDLPGVYTRVSAYLPWIQSFIASGDCGAA